MNNEKIKEGLCPYPIVLNNKCLCVGRDAHIPPFKKQKIAQFFTSFSKEVDFCKAKRRRIAFGRFVNRPYSFARFIRADDIRPYPHE